LAKKHKHYSAEDDVDKVMERPASLVPDHTNIFELIIYHCYDSKLSKHYFIVQAHQFVFNFPSDTSDHMFTIVRQYLA